MTTKGSNLVAILLVVVLIMVVTIIPLGLVEASGTLDQQQTEDDGPVNTLGDNFWQSLAQTFTAGLTGSLTEVDIVVGCLSGACGSSTVTVQIFSGSPPGTGVLLAQTSLSGSSVRALTPGPGAPFTAFTFTTPASVVAGKEYSIVLSSNAPAGTFAVGGSTSKVYSGGESYHYTGGVWVVDTLSGLDWAFDTYVTTTAVGGQILRVSFIHVILPWISIGAALSLLTVYVLALNRRGKPIVRL